MSFADHYLPMIDKQLADEESREVFHWRYHYFKTRDTFQFYSKLADSGADSLNRYNKRRRARMGRPAIAEMAEIFRFLDNDSARASGLVLYGAGARLPECVRSIQGLGIKIKAICDTYKSGGMYGNYPILSVDEALAKRNGAAILITTIVNAYKQEITQSLLERGISSGSIFYIPARDIYDAYVTNMDAKQYFDPDVISPLSKEVFVDAGCFDGRTILAFREFVGEQGYKRIYGFEPNLASFEKTQRVLKDNRVRDVKLIEKGLWDTTETLRFDNINFLDSGARISENGSCVIETLALDKAIDPDDKVTFIKMDVEGAELNALRGAAGIIVRDKPRLAICVYHKPEDIVEIPAYILSLCPEYRLYLRHYSPLNEWETVLYAI